MTHYSRIFDTDHSNDELYSIAYDETSKSYTYWYSNPATQAGWTEPANYMVLTDKHINASGECYVIFIDGKWDFKAAGTLTGDELRETVKSIDTNHQLSEDFVITDGDTSCNFGKKFDVGTSMTDNSKREGLALKVSELQAEPATWRVVPMSTSALKRGEIAMSIAPASAMYNASAIDLSKCSAPLDITENGWFIAGHTVYDYVADDGSLQKCIISGYEVFDLNNASDEIEYPNDTTQLRKETTCERIYIFNNQDEYDAAVKNREEGQAILNGEEVAPERCVILNGSIVPNLQYEVRDDGKIRISMRDLANAYSSKTIYIEENHILYVPMVYQYTAKFPTKDTPQSVLDNLNISEVVNPDDDTFTYTSTISMDLWNDTFELPQDDTYMMPIEHISRILGWEFWTGDNVLKIVSDELDDTNPDNFVIDTTVREETCYDVGTGEEIACD